MSNAQINALAVSHYGINVVEMDQTCALWLAERLATHHGQPGHKTWKRIDSMLRKVGKAAGLPAYGSVCF